MEGEQCRLVFVIVGDGIVVQGSRVAPLLPCTARLEDGITLAGLANASIFSIQA